MNFLLGLNYFLIILIFSFSNTKENESAATSFEIAVSCRKSDPQRALNITDSLLKAGRQDQVPNWRIWNLQANIYLKLRNTAKAIEMAQKSDSCYLSIFRRPNYEANRILAISYKDKDNLPVAHRYYQVAAQNAPDIVSRLNIVFNLSEIELAAGDTLSAQNNLKSNVQYIKSLRNSGFKGIFYLQYANLLAMQSVNQREILSWYLQACRLLEEVGEYERAGFCCVGIAKSYSKINIPDSCRWWFEKALQLQKKFGSPLGLADVYEGIAEHEFGNKRYKASQDYYLTALQYAQKANYLPILENILKQLSVVCEKNGDFKASVSYMKKYNSLKDSINKQKWLQQLSELQVKYSVKQKERELQQLKTRVGLFEKVPIVYLGGGILIFGLTLFGVLRIQKIRSVKDSSRIDLNEKPKVKTMAKERINLWNELQQILENEKLYRDPEINLNNLAQRLKTNRTTLSEVVNHFGERSFSNLINHLRVNEACELLNNTSTDNLTIEGIGINTGFKSRSAFYAAFISKMGETPSAFRKRRQQQSKNQY